MISLGIDIGGTGCKCVAFRDTGEQIAMSYREYPTKPGEVNLNALALRESVFFVISDCVKKLATQSRSRPSPSPPSASPSSPSTAAASR